MTEPMRLSEAIKAIRNFESLSSVDVEDDTLFRVKFWDWDRDRWKYLDVVNIGFEERQDAVVVHAREV